MYLNTEPVNPNVMTPQQYPSCSNLRVTRYQHSYLGPIYFPCFEHWGHTFKFFCPLPPFFSYIILNKAVILLHSHTLWGIQTLYRLPSITGLVTTITDAGNAVMAFTFKVRRVTLVIRPVCHGQSLFYILTR